MICGKFKPLALRKELIATNKRGVAIHMNAFIIKYLPSAENKMAFIVRKAFGNAVARNKIKRRIRMVVAKIDCEKADYNKIDYKMADYKKIHAINFIIIAKTEAISYPFNKLEDEINQAFCRIFEQINVKIN